MSRSALIARLDRLEARVIRLPSRPISKVERDERVRLSLLHGDLAGMLAGETNPQRRAAIEAAMRTDL